MDSLNAAHNGSTQTENAKAKITVFGVDVSLKKNQTDHREELDKCETESELNFKENSKTYRKCTHLRLVAHCTDRLYTLSKKDESKKEQ